MLKENSGRMVALLHVWLKACSLGVEYEEIRDIKARLKVLEEAKQ
jgi:acetylglutamate kinase